MLTQISHERNGTIQLKTSFDGDYPIRGLPPHITKGIDNKDGKIQALEFLTRDGSLMWYSFEPKIPWELRFRDKEEEMKLLVVTKGKFMLNFKDRKNWSLKPGNICMLHSNDYKIIIEKNSKVQYFIFPIDALTERLDLESPTENRFITTNEMDKIFREIINLHEPLVESQKKISFRLGLLLIELKNACDEGREIGAVLPYYREFLDKADEYISANATSKGTLTTKEITMACGLNECALKKLFKIYFGRTLGEQQNYYRVLEGKRLLSEEGKLISETAILVGFNSANTFRAYFLKFLGSNPSDWLKL